MFTLLWKIGPNQEELYQVASVATVPAAANPSDEMECGGRAHLAFQRLTHVEDGGAQLQIVRAVIDLGEVYVMNDAGKTVASYRFDADARSAIAA